MFDKIIITYHFIRTVQVYKSRRAAAHPIYYGDITSARRGVGTRESSMDFALEASMWNLNFPFLLAIRLPLRGVIHWADASNSMRCNATPHQCVSAVSPGGECAGRSAAEAGRRAGRAGSHLLSECDLSRDPELSPLHRARSLPADNTHTLSTSVNVHASLQQFTVRNPMVLDKWIAWTQSTSS